MKRVVDEEPGDDARHSGAEAADDHAGDHRDHQHQSGGGDAQVGAERQHGRAQADREGDPDDRADQTSCARCSLSYETGAGRPTRPTSVEDLFRPTGRLFRTCSERQADTRSMADFLAVLGIIGFAVVMLGLIWALDRV